MTHEMEIKQPNGYLFDSDGRICVRFVGRRLGTHTVAEHIDPSKEPIYRDDPGHKPHPKYTHPEEYADNPDDFTEPPTRGEL